MPKFCSLGEFQAHLRRHKVGRTAVDALLSRATRYGQRGWTMPQIAAEEGIARTTLSRAAIPGLLALGYVRVTRPADLGGDQKLAAEFEFTQAWWMALNSFKAKPSGPIFSASHGAKSSNQYSNHLRVPSSFKPKAKSHFDRLSKHASAAAYKSRKEKWQNCLTALSTAPSKTPLVEKVALGLLEKSELTPEQALESIQAALQEAASKPEVANHLTYVLGTLKSQDFRAGVLSRAKVKIPTPEAEPETELEPESELAGFATVLGVPTEDLRKFEAKVASIPEAQRPAQEAQEAAIALAFFEARGGRVSSVSGLANHFLAHIANPQGGNDLSPRGTSISDRGRAARRSARSIIAERNWKKEERQREATRAAEWAEIQRRAALPKTEEEIRQQVEREALEAARLAAEKAAAQQANAVFDAAAEEALFDRERDPERADFYELLSLIRKLHLDAGGEIEDSYWGAVFAKARLQGIERTQFANRGQTYTRTTYALEVPRHPWACFAQDTLDLTYLGNLRAAKNNPYLRVRLSEQGRGIMAA